MGTLQLIISICTYSGRFFDTLTAFPPPSLWSWRSRSCIAYSACSEPLWRYTQELGRCGSGEKAARLPGVWECELLLTAKKLYEAFWSVPSVKSSSSRHRETRSNHYPRLWVSLPFASGAFVLILKRRIPKIALFQVTKERCYFLYCELAWCHPLRNWVFVHSICFV